jgi:hypothetical protein
MTDTELVAKALSQPSGYSKVRLRMNLHPIQAKVLDALFDKENTRISLLAGNSTGKTTSVVATAVLYAIEIRNCLVVATSGVYRQITGQIIPALKKYSNLYPQWEFLENSISVGGIKKFIAFSSDDEGTAQGWHSKPGQPLLVILDEAATIKLGLYAAIERCHPTYMLVTGSPLAPEGMFYDIETKAQFSKDYLHFRLPATECVESKGYWLKDKLLDDMINRWGRQHPLVLSSVFAEFAQDSENSIISLSSWTKCINNPPPYIPGLRRVCIDFAAGGDSNCLIYRNGNKVEIIKVWREVDTMTAAGQIIMELDRLKKMTGLYGGEVWGDASGLGKPILDRLKEMGWSCNYFFGQAKPVDEHYKNSITECWLEAAKQIVNCSVILPNDDDLRGQLLGRKQRLNSTGRMELESKVEMKERGQPSPDVADAVAMVLGPLSAGELTFVQSRVPDPVYVPHNSNNTRRHVFF